MSSTNLSQRTFHLFNVPFECKMNKSTMPTAAVTPIVMPAIVPGGVGGGSVGSVIEQMVYTYIIGHTQTEYS